MEDSTNQQACSLVESRCEPCEKGAPPIRGTQIEELKSELDQRWEVIDEHHLAREFRFPDFASALAFVNRVGELAQQQGHHPDVYLRWGLARIELFTHKIKGLSRNDFIMAAKIDRLESGDSQQR